MSPRLATATHVVAAASGGVALWATLPPRGWWLLGPVAIALLALALRDRTLALRALTGAAFGLGWFIPALAWMWAFAPVGMVLAVLLEATIVTVAAVLTPSGRGRLVALPGALVLAEAARGRWPLGGLPLAGPALGQVDGPLLPAAATGGALLIVGLMALAGVALAALLERRHPFRAVAAAIVLIAVGLGLPAAGSVRAVGELRAAVVQGGGPRGIPAVAADKTAVLERHLRATDQVDASVELLLWPEGVVDDDIPSRAPPPGRAVTRLARTRSTVVVAGVVEGAGPERFRNAALAWERDGTVVDRYDKTHRVPFGEYIPWRAVVSRLADVSLVPRDAVPGDAPGLLATSAGELGAVISFEVFFSERARAAVRAGGQLLLVPTNAASFTGDTVPSEEVAAARLRAVETGRTVLQAAPTGYSAIIAPSGEVVDRSALELPAVLERDVALAAGTTPYTATGDTPVLLVGLLAVAAGWWPNRRPVARSRRRPPVRRHG